MESSSNRLHYGQWTYPVGFEFQPRGSPEDQQYLDDTFYRLEDIQDLVQSNTSLTRGHEREELNRLRGEVEREFRQKIPYIYTIGVKNIHKGYLDYNLFSTVSMQAAEKFMRAYPLRDNRNWYYIYEVIPTRSLAIMTVKDMLSQAPYLPFELF